MEKDPPLYFHMKESTVSSIKRLVAKRSHLFRWPAKNEQLLMVPAQCVSLESCVQGLQILHKADTGAKISQFSTLSTIWLSLSKFKWKKALVLNVQTLGQSCDGFKQELSYTYILKAKEKVCTRNSRLSISTYFFFFEKEQEGLSGQKEGLLSKGRGIA